MVLLLVVFMVYLVFAFHILFFLGQDLWLHSCLLRSVLLLLLCEVLLLQSLGRASHQGQVLLVFWLSMGLG